MKKLLLAVLLLVDALGDPLPQGAVARLGTARLRHDGATCVAAWNDLVATGGAGVKVFDAKTGRTLLDAPSWDASALALSCSGTLAVARLDGQIKLVNVAAQRVTTRLAGHEGRVRALAFSPDGALLASIGEDRAAVLWDAASGEELHEFLFATPPRSVAFTKHGEHLGVEEGTTRRFYSVETGAPVTAHLDLAPVTSSRFAVSLHPGHRVQISDLAFEGHERPLNTVRFSPDGTKLATAAEDGVFLWDVATRRLEKRLEGAHAAYSPDGTLARARLLHVESDEWICRRAKQEVTTLAFSPQGTLAVGARDQLIRLFERGRLRREIQAWGALTTLAWTRDGKALASTGEDGFVRFWDPVRFRELRRVEIRDYSVASLAFSKDGTLALGCSDRAVRLWSQEGVELAQLSAHTDRVNAVSFSPDGTKLASASEDGTTRIWDVAQRKSLRTLEGHEGGVRAVDFAPDASLLATGGADGTILLWDASGW